MTPGLAAGLAAAAGTAAWLRGGWTPPGSRLVTGPPWAEPGMAAPGWQDRWQEAAQALRTRLAPAWARWGPRAACAAVGVVLTAVLRSPLPALAGLGAAPFLHRFLLRRAAQRRAAAVRAGVIEMCSAVAGELRTGRLPNEVLAQAVADSDWLGGTDTAGTAADVLAAARFGGEVPAALRRAAALPGAKGLRWMAVCWQVALENGSRLADGLERVGDSLRAEEKQREELAAQLAGPRSTAALLAVLPGFGVALGTALGARPLQVLLHTPAGLGCLVIGTALEGIGLMWTARIVAGAM